MPNPNASPRLLAALCWLVLAAAGCGMPDEQQRKSTLEADLQACAEAKSAAQAKVATLQQELDELRKRGNVIYTVKMIVTLSGLTSPAASHEDGPGKRAVNFLSLAELTAQDGTTFKFIGRNQPGESPSDSLLLVYEPVNPSQLIARQIDTLGNIESVRLDFPASFKAAGIEWRPDARFQLQLDLNGLPVVVLEDSTAMAAARSGTPLIWKVAQQFRSIPQEYTRQLQLRARPG
jgi:hypothetical protein